MASNSNAAEIGELNKRLEWIDEERRRSARKLTELEQRLTLQTREISERDQRIVELERQIALLASQMTRIPQVDTQLLQFKDDIVGMIEQYDARRVQSEKELDRLRRIDHEGLTREIADIRKELPPIPRLQHDMELRQAEEARLAQLIGVQQSALAPLKNRLEELERSLTFLDQKEKQNSRNVGEIQVQLLEVSKKWAPLNNRIDILATSVAKFETVRDDLYKAQYEMRDTIKSWTEQVQVGEHERNQRLEKWRRLLEDQNDTLERFSRDWIGFSDQYKEAKMAVQTLSEWQKQIEQQQREASELLRIESNRMQSRWENFALEDQKKWKSFQVEAEQRWTNINRLEKRVQEQFMALEETLNGLEEEKDLLWRVQTAQSDAIKRIPHLWLDEVEKAIEQNPHRRRQPTQFPVREE